MKIKDIARDNGFDFIKFELFIENETNIPIKRGFADNTIPDSDVQRAVSEYKAKNAEKKQKTEKKQRDLSAMLITSGFSFDGYTIKKYSGYISGDDAINIPRNGFFSDQNNCQNLTDALVKIRRQAIQELKEAAYDLGCNAVIGVDFDYITIEPEHGSGIVNGVPGAGTVYEPYVICVTANGNAVIIEKKTEDQTNDEKIE